MRLPPRTETVTTHWGLDLGEAEIAAVKIAADRRVPEIVDYAFAPIAAGPSGRGPAETRQALCDLARRIHLRKAVVHVGGGGGQSVVRDELLSQEDLDGTPETVRRRLLDLLPGELDSREVRYEPSEQGDRDDELVPYRLISVPRESVERSYALMADAELGRAALHSGALALTAAAERLAPPDRPFALLRIGLRVTVLSIHEPGRVERFRIPMGEEDLAFAVAVARSVPTAEAYAHLTAGPDDPDVAQTSRAIAKPLEILARDAVRLLEYYSDRLSDAAPAAVHPVGSVATRPLIATRLGQVPELGLTPLLRPPDKVLRWSGRASGPDHDEAFPRLLGAIGAGLLGARPPDDALVLRPLPPAPEEVKYGGHLVASALVLVLLAVLAWVTHADLQDLRNMQQRQEDLTVQLPLAARTPEQVEEDRKRIQRRLGVLGRKALVRRALMAVDVLFQDPREGAFYVLERLDFDGERVEAVLHVRLPRGVDPARAGDELGQAATERLRATGSRPLIPRVEEAPGGFRLTASWRLGEP